MNEKYSVDPYTPVIMAGTDKLTLGGGRLVLDQKDLKLLKDFIERLVLLKTRKN